MAALVLPKPGTKLGPCKGGCEHKDCRQTIMDAQSVCWFCLKPIGYNRLYYRSQTIDNRASGYLAHAGCMETAVERNDPKVNRF